MCRWGDETSEITCVGGWGGGEGGDSYLNMADLRFPPCHDYRFNGAYGIKTLFIVPQKHIYFGFIAFHPWLKVDMS